MCFLSAMAALFRKRSASVEDLLYSKVVWSRLVVDPWLLQRQVTANHLFSWQVCALGSVPPAQQKWWERVLMKAKSEDPPLEFPSERVRSNDFAFLMLLLGKSNLCWAQQEWQDFGRPKDGPPDLDLVLDHSNPGCPLRFLLCLVYLIPAQETLWALSPQRGWVLSQWEASMEPQFLPCREKKSSAFFLTLSII